MSGASAIYDRIGTGYAGVRRPDRRIAAALERALGDAGTLANVGAGTGSYEPPARTVVAVEPSLQMIAQRAASAAPCVRAVAERLPLADRSVDAVLAVLTLHHWTDLRAGLAEAMRVARRRIVVLTWDPDFAERFWMNRDYVPEIIALDRARFAPIGELAAALPAARIEPVLIAHDCDDGFYGAYWRRPEAYLDPAVRAGISCLRQVDSAALSRGLSALSADLESGAFWARHAELESMRSLDLGYRIVTADLA